MRFLKADTSVVVRIGPAIDISDGYTCLATLDISTADYAILTESGGADTDISGNTWAAATLESTSPETAITGWYDLTLTAGQLDTEGPVTVAIYDVSLCLPIFAHFHVLNANVYDSLFAAATTDYLDVNVRQVSDDATSADNLESACTAYSATRGLAGTALPNAAADAAGGLVISDAGAVDIDALIAKIPDTISLANINAQVADVLSTDTNTQPSQGAPPANPTLAQVLMYLYVEYVRNKVVVDTNTANQKQVFADDGSTILYEKDLTNASDITTIAEATTGA